GLWRIGRIRIVVRAGELSVADAHLPLRYVTEVGVLDAAGKRAALGTRADPLARVVHRPWVPGAVLVILDHPADPAPYWMISSRPPERLARAIRAAMAARPAEAEAAGPGSTAGPGSAAAGSAAAGSATE